MASNATLVIKILADATQAATTMNRAGTNAGKFAGGLKTAAIPAAAILGGLTLMGKAAADDAAGQAMLAQAMQKTAGATAAQVAATEDWITKTTLATGVADDQLRPALAALTRATGDVGQSQAAMGVALDVAAATGQDVTAVADAMAKGYAGNTGALARLVPGLSKAATKSGDMGRVMDELKAKTGGAADTAANTATGKWKRMQTALNETKEGIGTGLLPVFDKAGGALATFGGWAATHTSTVSALAAAIGVLAAGVLAVNVAMKLYQATTLAVAAAQKAWAAAQWLLNAAMSANPIGIIIIAIIALVAAIIIAYKKSATFRAIVQAAFAAIGAAAKAVADAFIAAWNWIKSAALAAWNFIKFKVIVPLVLGFRALVDVVKTVVNKILEQWDNFKTGLKSVWDWIKKHVIDPFVNGFNSIVDAVKKVVDWIGKIKIPSGITKLFGGGKSAAAAAATPAPTVSTRGLGSTQPSSTAMPWRSPAGGGLVVNVMLDGRKVGGYLDRIVTERLEREGARLAAGAWS